LIFGEHALHLPSALVVQHAESEQNFVSLIAREKSGNKRSFIWVREIPQHVSVIFVGEIDIVEPPARPLVGSEVFRGRCT
jgi:hypothetical protein